MTLFIRLRAVLPILLLSAVSVLAQTPGVDILLSKARSLEARGRMDIAAQNWKQVLLVDPNQTEALAGLARYAKESGEIEDEHAYVERLRKINPKAPEISSIERMRVLTPKERARLDQAGRLTMQHKPDDAMKIYNEVFGNQPPGGEWAEPYYETEAASSGGREKAIAQLRRLSALDPANEMYRLWLARVLIYHPKTRIEGLRLLESIHDPGAVEQARTEWRQALVWEKKNPAVLPYLNTYLERYPDRELHEAQKAHAQKQEERAEEATKVRGFQALRDRKISTAEGDFENVLRRSPNDSNAVAGLAFVRLNQKRFDEAVSLFERARKLAPERADIREGYETAKFWSLMEQGSKAVEDHQPVQAYADVVEAYSHLTLANSRDPENWLGLIRTSIAAKNPKLALDAAQRIPLVTKRQLEARPDYLSYRALAYYETKQPEQGDRMLRMAMGAAAKADTTEALNARLMVASVLMDQGRMDAAIPVYQQGAQLHPDNVTAWEGLVGAYARARDFAQAKTAVRSMPQGAYEIAINKTGFLDSMAAIYAADGECSEAEELLNRLLNLDRTQGSHRAENAQLRLADIWLREGNVQKALDGYRTILASDQNSLDAWRGYIVALHDEGEDRDVVAETQRMPAAPRAQIEKDATFLSLLAGVRSTLGNYTDSVQLLEKARALYESRNQVPPSELDLQLAWAMLDSGQRNPRIFFEKVKARTDLSKKQRATIDEIWAIWSVHTAEQALSNNEPEQAIAILIDAQRALPANPTLYGKLASVYIQQHNYQKALAVYESWGLTGAEPGDYSAAVGTALAAHRNDLVQFYLEQGLRRFPNDPDLLETEGKQAIARGNYKEGQTYLESALRAAQHPVVEGLSLKAPGGFEREKMGVSNNGELRGGLPGTSQAPACRLATSSKMPDAYEFQMVRWRNDDQDHQTGNDKNNAIGSNAANGDENNKDQNQATSGDGTSQDHAQNPRDIAARKQRLQDEIDVVQNRNTPFGHTGDSVSGRSGDPGIDRLIIEDASVGASGILSDKVRFGVVGHGLYLYSGSPTGQSTLRFGTLLPGVKFGEQAATGFAGEVQMSTANFGLQFGAVQGFPVNNLIGGMRYRPLGGPITFMVFRENVKNSLLSYAGVRDPRTQIVWGGVVSNTGAVYIEHKTRRAGQYASGAFSYFTGQNVKNNWSASGNAGFYFIVLKGLSVGLSLTGMHYDRNLNFYSLGQGGYFSPQQYALASIPVSWFARHKRFEYEISGSLGVQYFAQDRSLFFPARINVRLPNGFYPSSNNTGPNYYFLGRLGYRVAPHVYLDTFASANNSNNYAAQTVGFSLKFMTRRLPTSTDLHVNSLPDWRGNPPFAIEEEWDEVMKNKNLKYP